MNTKTERAELGVDGNCGFALLGSDIQMGEAEFVEVQNNDPWRTRARAKAERRAATAAYRKLKARLPDRKFSYFIGKSHPDYS